MTRPLAADGARRECPLCGALVAPGAEAMNQHFEGDCTSFVAPHDKAEP